MITWIQACFGQKAAFWAARIIPSALPSTSPSIGRAAFLGLPAALYLGVFSPSLAQPRWTWVGGVSATSAVVTAGVQAEGATLRYGLQENLAGAASVEALSTRTGSQPVSRFTLTGLEPDTRYHYEVEGESGRRSGSFHTFKEGPYSFSFAAAACASTGSASSVFDVIRRRDPLFFIHMGDLHYEDIGQNDPARFASAYESVLDSSTQEPLYSSLSMAYTWDDHDFGSNNSDGSSSAKPAAQSMYRVYVPHYPLEDDEAIYQSFTVGRVLVLLTDVRSEKGGSTILGSEQKTWLKAQMMAAKDKYPLIVWVNGVPWIASSGGDNWSAKEAERKELSQWIVDRGITGILMLSGDAHMLAIDDGSNNDYAGNGQPGFPVFQAAALDRRGSEKGGPYSEGTYPGGGQFGWIEVVDQGGESIEVTLTGYRNNDAILTHSFSVPAPKTVSPLSPKDNLGSAAQSGEAAIEQVRDVKGRKKEPQTGSEPRLRQ